MRVCARAFCGGQRQGAWDEVITFTSVVDAFYNKEHEYHHTPERRGYRARAARSPVGGPTATPKVLATTRSNAGGYGYGGLDF